MLSGKQKKLIKIYADKSPLNYKDNKHTSSHSLKIFKGEKYNSIEVFSGGSHSDDQRLNIISRGNPFQY